LEIALAPRFRPSAKSSSACVRPAQTRRLPGNIPLNPAGTASPYWRSDGSFTSRRSKVTFAFRSSPTPTFSRIRTP